MKEFEDIRIKWQNQANKQAPNNGAKKVIEKTRRLKSGQRLTSIILSITVAILVIFFFYVKAYSMQAMTIGLGIMILSVIVRILMELLSLRQLKQIKYDLSLGKFKEEMIAYYKVRLRTHYIFTPIILVLYVIGFVILMPLFKSALSTGFYTYIKVSGLIVLVVGAYLIFMQIKKELFVLRSLIA